MSLFLQAVRVATGSDKEGMLVFADDQRLVVVLTRLCDRHGKLLEHWFLEAGFGPLDGPNHPTFSDLDTAQNWIGQRLAKRQGNDIRQPG